MNPVEGMMILASYTANLPNLDFYSLREKVLEVLEDDRRKEREELGTFQAFDFSSSSLLFPYILDFTIKTLERMLNIFLLENGHEAKVEIAQQKINGLGTATFEIIIYPLHPSFENRQEHQILEEGR